MVNVIAPKLHVVEADSIVPLVSNNSLEVNLSNDPKKSNHRGHRRWRVCRDVCRNPGDPYTPQRNRVLVLKCNSQDCWKEYMEVGVSHNSVETGNDRGAKGRQIELAKERNNDRTQH